MTLNTLECDSSTVAFGIGPNTSYPRSASIAELFEEQVRQTPEHVALLYERSRLSYRDLNVRANRLAKALKKRGVLPDMPVGIIGDRSPETIVGILAILKAGGGYLPLDPNYPAERADFMLKDAGVSVLLGRECYRNRFSIAWEYIEIQPIESDAVIEPSDIVDVAGGANGANLAYVLFTSGSTGTPKGVCISQCAVARLVLSTNYIDFRTQDRVLQASALSFDASTFEIWGALLNGATLCLTSKETLLTPSAFAAMLKRDAITVALITTPLFRQLAATVPGAFADLRVLVFGGDVVDARSIREVIAAGPPRRLVNAYGPTECTTIATAHEIQEAPEIGENISIGKPISNTQVYVLDARLAPVPIGVAGEIYLGGDGLARGYLHRPDLTDAHFIPNPLKQDSRELVYRTGDMARWRPDGTLEFLGRIDSQVKLNGFRVELGEIEHALRVITEVGESAVTVREATPGTKQLVAYVSSRPGYTVQVAQLRDKLQHTLPKFMVPHVFVVLEKLPLTSNGKLDMAQLPAPTFSSPAQGEPKSTVESEIATIWAEVLRVDNVRVDLSFVEMGGDSLLAVELVHRLNGALNTDFSVRSILEGETVVDLARRFVTNREAREVQAGASFNRTDRSGPLPLSYPQRQIWFAGQLAEHPALYNECFAVSLPGDTRPDVLKRAFQLLISRHESLRTTFEVTSSGPVQRVNDDSNFELDQLDMQSLPIEVRSARALQYATANAQKSFDLARGPLLRATFVRMSSEECRLYLCVHHLVIDGVSAIALLTELRASYIDTIEQNRFINRNIPLQYGDYAMWQWTPAYQRLITCHLDYWTNVLSGIRPLELPVQRARQASRSFVGAQRLITLPKALSDSIKRFAEDEKTTVFVTMLATFGALLHRYSAADDIVIGSAFSIRTNPSLADIIGLFVNALPLRLRFPSGLEFRELVQQVRQSCLDAIEHAEAPFERIVDVTNPPRSPGENPVFQVSFTFEARGAHDASSWEVRPYEVHNGCSKLDLSVAVDDRDDGLVVRLEYARDLFDDWFIEQFAAHYVRLLKDAMRSPTKQIRDFSLLSEAEKANFFKWTCGSESSDTKAPVGCLHSLFENQVERTPEEVAVVFDGTRVTYRELNDRANQLAHAFLAAGVKRGERIGVCLRRSIEMVVSVLAVLKAGATYTPLDPTYPEARLNFIIEDSGIQLIIAEDSVLALCSDGVKVLRVDQERSRLRDMRTDNPSTDVTSDDVAYVIYTSGTTGKPKGVLIGHRSAYRLFRSNAADLGFRAGLRVLQFARLGFDASIYELFMTLTSGGTLYLVPQEVLLPGPELADFLDENEINLVVMPPSALKMLPRRDFSALEVLTVTGEECPAALVDVWAPGRRFINGYGPTEGTIGATYYDCKAGGGKPFIGHPLRHCEVFVLDGALQPVPTGVAGEIFIGGDAVALGYWNRPELDAGKFLAHPFSDRPGARLYRTGDLARYQPDGTIEYLGRSDSQVKLRGIRIELGEIEAILREHPAILDAVVVVQSVGAEMALTAYVVCKERAVQSDTISSALRHFLRGRLPENMVPSDFVVMDAFPLGPNDKLDRQKLPAPRNRRSVGGSTSGPLSNTETILADIWSRLLDRAVDVRTPFFEAGGNSLALIRLQMEMESTFGIRVPVTSMFQYPTIESMARYLDELSHAEVKTVARTGPTVLTQDEIPARLSGAHGQVAIVARVGRFPGARNVEELWKMLVEGRAGTTRFTLDEIRAAGVPPELVADPLFVPVSGMIEDADQFDAELFGYAPEDARLMDPQLRLFLECAWEALEQAGYAPGVTSVRVGVFGGAGVPRDWLQALASRAAEFESISTAYRMALGNPWQFLATTVAFKLGLRGPALTIQTACSTSLVAVHLACQSLLANECDMAIAGGVALYSTEKAGYLYEEGGILSPDGHCRPFDRQAQGTVPSSGVGVVVLKRLQKALQDGDHVYAVIRGSAINNDGFDKVGFTAPSISGQKSVIEQAHAAAGLGPEAITYVEAHGTATPLGDPVEVRALQLAFGEKVEGHRCILGSLKGNLGHLDAAAGIAGLIKLSLMLENRYIPPTLHFEEPNPQLELESSPLLVNGKGLKWEPAPGRPRIAAVSSFGIGGTNAHIVLEEAPAQRKVKSERHAAQELIVLSARSREALESSCRRLSAALRDEPELDLTDVAHTLQRGRRAFAWRRAFTANTVEDAVRSLNQGGSIRRVDDNAEVAFLFPGMGTQRVWMGEALYRSERRYREVLDHCIELFEQEAGIQVRTALFAPKDRWREAEEALRMPALNMASIFSTEYALAQLLGDWGIRPSAVIGHSLGEYTAACVAGILSLSDAIALIALRGRICDQMPPSGMSSVQLPEEALREELSDGVHLAAVNGPRHCVVSGLLGPLEVLESKLQSKAVRIKRLPIAGGFHSPLVEPAMHPLIKRASEMSFASPQIPLISNVTATWIGESDVFDASYWATHLRQPVRFSEGLSLLMEKQRCILVEVGPGRTLETFAMLHPNLGEGRTVLTTLATPEKGEQTGDDVRELLDAVGQLWAAGISIDWDKFQKNGRGRRVSLPTYPFERKRYTLRTVPPAKTENSTSISAGERGATAPRALLSHPQVVAIVEDVWKDLLGVDSVEPGSHFFELGGTSLLAIKLNGALRDELNIKLVTHAVLEHPTLADFSRLVVSAYDRRWRIDDRNALMLRVQEGRAESAPLVLVQPIGGTAYTYVPLARHLDLERPVYAFRASGLEDGEHIYRDIPTMAERYVDELLEVHPKGPLFLGGHSAGGVIAYEMAYILWKRGMPARGVFQIDSVTTDQSRRTPIRSVMDVERVFGSIRRIAPATLNALLSGIHSDPRLRDVVLATNEALSTYVPVKHPVRLVYLRAEERDSVFDQDAERWWRDMTLGDFVVHSVPGNHFSVMDEPQVAEVARLIETHMYASER